MNSDRQSVKVGGRRLQLSNLGKELYPSVGWTKADVVDYYNKIAPVLLPHLYRRPVTLKRYPDGVEGEYFYEKNCPEYRPGWVATGAISSGDNGDETNYCLVDNLETLIWVANLAALELHTVLAPAEHPSRPNAVVFDLDPGPGADLVDCSKVAVTIRELLSELGLTSFAKVSGLKGLQLYIPINGGQYNFELTKAFSKQVSEAVAKLLPDLVVTNMRKELRKGKVLIDWSQNSRHKSTISVYSLRAGSEPTVSAPVGWEELETVVASGEPKALVFDPSQTLDRVAKYGDCFEPVLSLQQKLPGGL